MKKIRKQSLNETAGRMQAVSTTELTAMVGGNSQGDCSYKSMVQLGSSLGLSYDAGYYKGNFANTMYPEDGVWVNDMYGNSVKVKPYDWACDGPHSVSEAWEYMGKYLNLDMASQSAIDNGSLNYSGGNCVVIFSVGGIVSGSIGDYPEAHTATILGYDSHSNSYITKDADGNAQIVSPSQILGVTYVNGLAH